MSSIGTPHTRGAGYKINNKNLNVSCREEADIRTCPHCQTVIEMQAWRKNAHAYFCTCCMAPTCDKPFCNDGCFPFIKQLEQAFELGQKLQQFKKLAGTDARPPDHQPKLMSGVIFTGD